LGTKHKPSIDSADAKGWFGGLPETCSEFPTRTKFNGFFPVSY